MFSEFSVPKYISSMSVITAYIYCTLLFLCEFVVSQLAQAEGRVILTCGQPFQTVSTYELKNKSKI